METCVLIPQELSLVLIDEDKRGSSQQRVGVFTNAKIPQGVRIFPFQGTIRIDKLKVFDYLEPHDVSTVDGRDDEQLKRRFFLFLRSNKKRLYYYPSGRSHVSRYPLTISTATLE
jgi:hypothetical protein